MADRSLTVAAQIGARTVRQWFSTILGWGQWFYARCLRNRRLGTPVIAAHVKGPNQINLTWAAVTDPGYGYLVEIQSAGDSRYTAWTELEPIPRAGGYTCDSSIVARGARCNISDPTGQQVYNPPNRGIPYWVTEAQYADPQDGTAAQFIAWGLKPHTTYFSAYAVTREIHPRYSALTRIRRAPRPPITRCATFPRKEKTPTTARVRTALMPGEPWRTRRGASPADRC